MTTQGVMYVALGWHYLAMAVHSARSFRRENPGRGITVVTNVAFREDLAVFGFNPKIDVWIEVPNDASTNRQIKTSADLYSPYERTLLLDADSLVLGNLDIPFRLLDFADVLIKLDPKGQNRPWQRDEPIFDVGRMGDLPAWNGGVVFFRRGPGSRSLFHHWSDGFLSRRSLYDQPALVEAVLASSARVLPLDERWNSPTSRYRQAGGLRGPTKILHYMSRMPHSVAADIEGILSSLEPTASFSRAEVMENINARREQTPLNSRRYRIVQRLYRRQVK